MATIHSHAPPEIDTNGAAESWNYSVPSQDENSRMGNYVPQSSRMIGNGTTVQHQTSRPELNARERTDSHNTRMTDGYLLSARINDLQRKDSSLSDTGSAPDSLLDLYGNNRSGMNSVDLDEKKGDGLLGKEAEKWIHRDKLAQIESQELQAAGIILPRTRSASKSNGREHSREQQSHGTRSEQDGQKRHRIEGSSPTDEAGSWDLRLPEERQEDSTEFNRDFSGGRLSRIPVHKDSPIPIPLQHLERDTPLRRDRSGGWVADEEGPSYPKSRGRSESIRPLDTNITATTSKRLASDTSPTKKFAIRKTSTPAGRTASTQRPKTRSGPGVVATSDTSGTQRPVTRAGDISSQKRPEGDPPWLATMYKPDPRLPPDQQLLPTVAKRLQQEQWEKEGKFGNAYDTTFRPLNDEEFPLQPFVPEPPQNLSPEKTESDSEWPLKRTKSHAPSTTRPGTAGGGGSYSTIPKIATGKPQGLPPQQSPIKTQATSPIRMEVRPEYESKEKGCCCIVM
ncbi:hypothetical protein BJ878DRAFT_543757 [Calycina marina]|uniref:Uncharacterized protein n=1 Tax=Calycina marina TaxID=1763456 RepID=A0A9P8CDP9_9HELO|nr:hypothetical protein BJ878DRAFT_543757 [Calycina marina]